MTAPNDRPRRDALRLAIRSCPCASSCPTCRPLVEELRTLVDAPDAEWSPSAGAAS